MTRLVSYSCAKCRQALDFGLGRMENSCLVVDCPKCGATVRLESGLTCRDCGAPATQFNIKGLSPVSVLYYCDQHLDAAHEARKIARKRSLAFYLPLVGTALIVVSFLDRSNPGKPFLPFILAGLFCWGGAISLWLKRRPSRSDPVDSE